MHCLNFPKAFGEPLARAVFRAQWSDFQVDEVLGFSPSGDGEHHLVLLEKAGTNTEWLARRLADFCQVKAVDVGFCGLKDRHAVTRQWFSVYAPKVASYAWENFPCSLDAEVRLLDAGRHNKKLKRGMHAGNRFRICLRDFSADPQALAKRLANIASLGVPNYFGEQRFGRDGNNLREAERWFAGARLPKAQLGFAMSAARSYLFNQVLAARVRSNTWHCLIEGDVAIDDGPSGPLWGRGRSPAIAQALEVEHEALAPYAAWQNALEHCGLAQERRALVLRPQALSHHYAHGTLKVEFELEAGAFATALLSELAHLHNSAGPASEPAESPVVL